MGSCLFVAANDGKVRMISCGADKSIYFRTAQKVTLLQLFLISSPQRSYFKEWYQSFWMSLLIFSLSVCHWLNSRDHIQRTSSVKHAASPSLTFLSKMQSRELLGYLLLFHCQGYCEKWWKSKGWREEFIVFPVPADLVNGNSWFVLAVWEDSSIFRRSW